MCTSATEDSVVVQDKEDLVNEFEIIFKFLDGEKIKQFPSKQSYRFLILKYLASKFEKGKDYTEKEVNDIIDTWHTFGDYFILRRELIESKLLNRLANGSKYWRE